MYKRKEGTELTSMNERVIGKKEERAEARYKGTGSLPLFGSRHT